MTSADLAVLRACARQWGVLVSDLQGRHRSTEFTRPRQAAMLLLRDGGASFPAIGRVLGRDHSTVISGVRRALLRCSDDAAYLAAVVAVRDELRAAVRCDGDVMDAVEREVA